jgi:hypothetical protein
MFVPPSNMLRKSSTMSMRTLYVYWIGLTMQNVMLTVYMTNIIIQMIVHKQLSTNCIDRSASSSIVRCHAVARGPAMTQTLVSLPPSQS